MTYLRVDSPYEALQAYAHTANYYYSQALRNGIPQDYTKARHTDYEEDLYDKLWKFIRNNDLEGLKSTLESESYNINYRDQRRKETLLHVAYDLNKPQIIEFLLSIGADAFIPNKELNVPLGLADDNHVPSTPTVFKEIVSRCLQSTTSSDPDLHMIFKTTLDFIRERRWTFVRSEREELRGAMPFRDGATLMLLGLPHLSYRVNCYDLSHLFIKTVQKIGVQAEKVEYSFYKTIRRADRDIHKVNGAMHLFDEEALDDSAHFEFSRHCVAMSKGTYFDLTLMCTYQEKNAILEKKT